MNERKGYKRKEHEDRKDLAGEHSVGNIGQIERLTLAFPVAILKLFLL